MLNSELSEITNRLDSISKQLETQNLIQIVINLEKPQNFPKKDIEKFKDIIKSRL